MHNTATLTIDGQTYELPIVRGTEGEVAIDVTALRSQAKVITLDPGYANTGSCTSTITFVDGEKGILRYRGYPIEQLAEYSSFVETAMLLVFGELPTKEERAEFRAMLGDQALLHEDLLHHFDGFPPNGHPMAILAAVINSLGTYYPDLLEIRSDEEFRQAVAKLISKVRTIAAFSYRKSRGLPIIYPDPRRSYCENFLHMMFSVPYREYTPTPEALRALSLFLLVHADHEQNCSCSTVRMVGSSEANLFASVSAGVSALWGRLHGGANSAVLAMLEQIRDGDLSVRECVDRAKRKEFRLMGFGHRVYKNFDPRAKVLKAAAKRLLTSLNVQDDLLEIAQELEDIALSDDYFVERKLYPNVDFYSGIILRALGIPTNMFPVMFAMGRMPGWIAHWHEQFQDPNARIHRPRQIYMGPAQRDYIPMHARKRTS
ncbi:MAG: citrate synthase [Desulfomicrobiaceae bacterium]|jgi:citrate synthase|nr:citrate synthase [Desulfomicrobiaceae bacterium]